MAIPSSYTDTTLAQYMADTLGEIADVLGLTAGNQVTMLGEAMNDVLLAYGVDDVDDATDIQKVRTLARVEAWRFAVDSLTARFDFSNPEGYYNRSQMLEAAKERLSEAEYQAQPYMDAVAVVRLSRVTRTQDPYAVRDWDA